MRNPKLFTRGTFCLFIILFLFLFLSFQSSVPPEQKISTQLDKNRLSNNPLRFSDSYNADSEYGNIPLYFIQNEGQMNEYVKYLLKIPNGNVYFTSKEIVYQFLHRKDKGKNQVGDIIIKEKRNKEIKVENIRVRFIGANEEVKVEGREDCEARASYFRGNDPRKWVKGARTFEKVIYRELYPHIDLVVGGNKGKIKHEYRVKVGGEIENIKIRYEGIKRVVVNERGQLEIETGEGVLREDVPLSYQMIGDRKVEVESGYVVDKEGFVRFKVGEYREDKELIIDPDLIYSTYLGGGSWDRGYGIAVDGSGNAYVTGETYSNDFPTTPGAFDTSHSGGYDVFITKLNATGTDLIYSTYLGGGGWDRGYGIAVDGSGCAFVTGYTNSSDFPTTPGAFDTTYNYADVFITKLNATGTDLIYSTYLGGSDDREWSNGIAVDGSGCAYVTGRTDSVDFPTTPGAYDTIYNNYDVFITKLNATGTVLLYSTYLGGTWGEEGWGIGVDGSGCAYVTGRTDSNDFPTTPGAYKTSNITTYDDVFITKLNATGTDLIYSTYLGGAHGTILNNDYGLGIAVDTNGNAYVTGYTDSKLFPTTPGAFDTSHSGHFEGFITKLNAIGTDLIYSTYLGGRGHQDRCYGIAIDGSGNAYVTGRTDSTNFPITPGAFDTTYNDWDDAFITKLNATGTDLIYSTYLGGSEDDYGRGIAVDGSGNAYVTGYTDSNDFPTTPGAFDTTYNDRDDAFITKILFGNIYPPLNFSGQKVLNRSLSQREYVNVLTWQANPDNQDKNIVNYRIYQIEGNSQSLLTELDSSVLSYWHRNVEKDKTYIYAIAAVTGGGVEGIQAQVTVQ